MNEMESDAESETRETGQPLFARQEHSGKPEAVQVEFQAHVELLWLFLDKRTAIVDNIGRLLNCQKKPEIWRQEPEWLSHAFRDCLFGLAELGSEQRRLRDQLEQAHWANGFKPRQKPGNDLVDPAEMMRRAFHFWQQTRWPGSKGRVHYAHTLFNLYLIRCLALLSMRLWGQEEGSEAEGESGGVENDETGSVKKRLSRLQGLLDEVWAGGPADQPVLVRDVRWLIPVALSPTTDRLHGYFEVAARIEAGFPQADRVETQKAWVQTGAGHLCSQLRHLSVQREVSIDDHELVLLTRLSNALDIALIVEGLVSLLGAYRQAIDSGDEAARRALAAAICHGIAPDPELFLLRLDLLGPYTMIEYLFVATNEQGGAAYTPMGERHLRLLGEYRALVSQLAEPLLADFQAHEPVDGGYEPHGVLYGFSSNLLELMAFKTLQRDTLTPFSLEDVFTSGGADKRAWVTGWRKLPHVAPEVVRQFDYPEDFAEALRKRVGQTLERRVAAGDEGPAVSGGRLYIVSEDEARNDPALAQIPELPARYILSSDPVLVAAGKATAMDERDLLHCRLEGEFLLSYQAPGGWIGISKNILTGILGAGQSVTVSRGIIESGETLQLLCSYWVSS